MSTPHVLEAALRRLSAALDHLDAAADRRAKSDAARGDLEEELAIMQDDRSRLAIGLEGALNRIKSLELAHSEAELRLERAGAAIRAVMHVEAPEIDEAPETGE